MASITHCGEMEQEPEEVKDALDPDEQTKSYVNADQEGYQRLQAHVGVPKSHQETYGPSLELERKMVKHQENEKQVEYEDDMEKVDDKEKQAMGCNCGDTDKGVECKECKDNNVVTLQSHTISVSDNDQSDTDDWHMSTKTVRFGKTVHFSETEEVIEGDSLMVNLFPDHDLEEWTTTSFGKLFMAEDWIELTDDHLLKKKVLEAGPRQAPYPVLGQEVMLKMQGILEDRTMVEKDCKLVFVTGEGDVNQALEYCVMSMRKGEVALLLADSQYTYGHQGREPDIPPGLPILYQLQLLEMRDKLDLVSLPIADRIRIGSQKRERGNFHFQREEYDKAAFAYCMALDVLTTQPQAGRRVTLEEEEEVKDYRVKCLNNLVAAQLKLQQFSKALDTIQEVLSLDPNNVKALFRKGKLLSDRGDYEEAMRSLKNALKLEPSTRAIHVELSKLVKRQPGKKDLIQNKLYSISSMFLLGALVVALGSLATSVFLTARN